MVFLLFIGLFLSLLFVELEKALVFSEFGFMRSEELYCKMAANMKRVVAEPRPCVG